MRVIIVGAGKLGYKLAEALLNGDTHVIMMDTDAKVLERINDHLDVLTIKASGLQLEALKELNIHTCDLIIAVTSSDETNMIICSMAKKLGCRRAIARIRNPEYAQQLDFFKNEMKIDHVVNPELAVSNEIIRYLLKRYALYTEEFAKGKVCMFDFSMNNLPDFIGKKLSELKDIQGMLIVAIERDGEIIIPYGATTLEHNDTIYVIGKKDCISQLAKMCKGSIERKFVRRVMVLGGGKIGYYLAEKLMALGVHVKLIEQDKERCKYLSEHLPNTLVIHGDGTDINLLDEEDMASMDAFVGVTGFDEENLLMSLMAKQAGVEKVIAKVSRTNYVHVIEKLGIDVALNPVNITASEILKFIRGGRVVSVSLLLRGQAEVTEVIAKERMQIVGKPICELELPKGIIIGAIVRQGRVLIPDGRSVIQANDRLVIFCLQSEITALEMFLNPHRGGLLGELWNRSKGFGKSFNN
ncbi:trk system potassium uptake protein TrkA [Geosporobacter subterraneus DSM 17957]|uniref:Trk system potassium uptake protein TrkA n=1 Tax=Geosporobacter subterraneus DSM 17957 TaxID=1121919 RepID=A0A1M6MW89_9FIRM|nr:Trk system potassium transporter TrkA [Geosporobacter subterraneus]SHJ87686.1 trk system potassium uptake protein TrkA [Geosporobacter subterraneus DSM 17957]